MPHPLYLPNGLSNSTDSFIIAGHCLSRKGFMCVALFVFNYYANKWKMNARSIQTVAVSQLCDSLHSQETLVLTIEREVF